MTPEKLNEILEKHKKWVRNEGGGERANLTGANLSSAKNIPFIPYSCPDFGAFIGYKKANRYIVELEILAKARQTIII